MEKKHTIIVHTENNSFGDTPKYYHLCSEGLKTDVLFRNQEEFVDGMNCIAIAASRIPLTILAFCIMGNHFHFILKAFPQSIREFAFKINHCYAIKRKNWNAGSSLPKAILWEAFEIQDDKYLRNSIAYVMNNPVKAGYDKWILDYPWSSNSLYFRDSIEQEKQTSGLKKISELPQREIVKHIRSYKSMPKDWLITSKNYIWPGSYVDWQNVEKLFRDIRQLKYHLISRKEQEETELSIVRHRLTISDEEIREIVIDTSENMFHVVETNNLSINDRIKLAQRVIQKTGCRREQLYRILHIQEK